MRFAPASLLLALLAFAYARPLIHIDSDELKAVDTVSRLNPRSPAFWKWKGKKSRKEGTNSVHMGHMEQQPQPSATLGKKHVQFAHNPVSATINRPESSESETESFRSNAQGPHEPMKLFVTLTGDAAGKVADENQLEAIPSIIEIRLSDWAREEFSENLRMIFVADENGAGAVWKFKKSVTDPFSFVYWFEGKGEPVKYSANLPERKSSFLR